MLPLHTIPDADAYNQQALQRLLRTFRLSQGDFTLMLAYCNYQELQNHIVTEIQNQSSYQILQVTLEPLERTLFTPIQRGVQQYGQIPDVIMVSGLTQLQRLQQVLKITNQMRDEFRKQFPCPLVLWANNEVLRQLIRLAPDFQSWATTMDFQLSTVQLVKELEDGDRALFNHLLQAGGGQFVPNSRLFGGRYHRRELEAAVEDLHQRQYPISPSLSASLTFVEGREAYETAAQQRDLDQALVHYQRAIECYETSLEFWHTHRDLQRQGCGFYHLGIAWVARGERYRAEHYVCYQTALTHFWRCIDTFAQMERPDYEARFINVLCFTLQRLNQRPKNPEPQWDELEQWAKRSLYLQQQQHDQFRLARAYSFLSEVAIARTQWLTAKEFAETALVILTEELNNPEAGMASGTRVDLKWERSFHQGWYLLALAQANLQLGQVDAALDNLHKAKQETEIDYDPELYIRILNQLRHIYFEAKKDYPTAFKIRQQRRLVEYQYNFRAFVGAGHLQPKHQIINPILTTHLREHTMDYMVPSDFQTSGRQEDIERLLQRIASTNYRLTVIHGQSGVGKSSILEAGLLPMLQQRPVSNRSVIPIFQQVYAEWEQGLLQSVLTSLRYFQRQQSPDFDLYSPELEQVCRGNGGEIAGGSIAGGSIAAGETVDAVLGAMLAQLRWHSQHNIVTVLLFDQFEEFFFASKNRRDRQHLYQFIKDSLDISFVNIVISIREDYLHRLLEITRCLDLDVINNDILSRETLYHIGNFSPQRARTVIHTLAAKTPFQLEDDLIDRLVADLSEETGVVTPIELQVVGSQLQTEEITSLAEYEQKGPMVQLVQRYLDGAVKNCGPEHQQMAEYLLYALTDEHQLRPLRTLTELADACGAAPQHIDWMLDILVGAGMVVEFPEASSRYYQLVHDYLVPFIRSDRHANLLDSLTWTKAELKQALRREARVRVQAEMAEVKALNALSKALLLSHDHLNALMKGVESAQKLITIQQTYANLMHQGEPGEPTLGDTLRQIENDTINRLRHTLSHIKEVNRLEGHDAKTFGVAFHPNGELLASGSADHTVRVWSVTGKAIATCEGHRDQVFGVAFSPDGRFLLSASADKTIKLWRSRGGIPIRTFSGHTDTVFSVVFHPHQPIFASASGDGSIRLWNITGGTIRTLRRGGNVYNISFSPDGTMLASSHNTGKIRIWRLDGTLLREIKGHDSDVFGISYDADGQALISASADGSIKRWQRLWGLGAAPHRSRSTLIYQLDTPAFSVCSSPDGQIIALTAKDGRVRLCNLDGQLVQTFQGHRGMVYGICFSPDGRLLASTGDDKTIRLWNLDGIGLHVPQGHKGRVLGTAFSPDGNLATAGEDHTVKLWHSDGSLLKTFHGHSDLVRQVNFSPDGLQLASASNDGTVKLWCVDGSLLQTFTHHYGGVRDVSFSRDGQWLVSAGNDRIVRLWSVAVDPNRSAAGDRAFQEFHGARARIPSVALHPECRCIVAASGRSMIIWWLHPEATDASNNKPIHIPHAHSARVLAVTFSPDGNHIATAGADKLIKVWRPDGTWVQTIRGHQATVKGIRFSPDGGYLISFGSDRTVRIWNRDGHLRRTLRGHLGSICGVSWQLSPQQILSVGESSIVKGWQVGDLAKGLTGRENNDPGSVPTEIAIEQEQPSLEFVLDARKSLPLSDNATVNLQQLVKQGCQWLKDYLAHNPCLSESDRSRCL
ncbi:MAG: hypothetical protein F6K30_13350 [Cyanothece sp. SIO2G6]|nr:hypothetical protein [Cyanothece sp. SIO2G6]